MVEPQGTLPPPHNLKSWFQCKGQGKTRDDSADHIPHDFYVIGTQEDPLGEREWADTVKNVLKSITNISFKQVGGRGPAAEHRHQQSADPPLSSQVAVHTLWSSRIVVLVKPEHENRISHILSDSVKTGIANTFGKHRLLPQVPVRLPITHHALL